jgi:endonuclease/exonuclease/phosphatase family metal-dependent hydrolase
MRVTRGSGIVKTSIFALTLLTAAPTQAVVAAPQTLRILAYNIHHGAGLDGKLDLERIARVITAVDPDVVALQEVDSCVTRTEGVDQATVLASLTGMHSVFGHFMDYQGGRYGMALLSRLPIVESTSHRLPDGEEPRTALAVTLRLPDGDEDVVVIGIHFYRSEEERLAQARRLIEIYKTETSPVILAGDFNSTRSSPVMDLIGQQWSIPDKGNAHFTFPADGPEREIDFIAFRPADRFTVVASRVIPDMVASDHRPVLLVIEY